LAVGLPLPPGFSVVLGGWLGWDSLVPGLVLGGLSGWLGSGWLPVSVGVGFARETSGAFLGFGAPGDGFGDGEFGAPGEVFRDACGGLLDAPSGVFRGWFVWLGFAS